jgi:hypothetical protein
MSLEEFQRQLDRSNQAVHDALNRYRTSRGLAVSNEPPGVVNPADIPAPEAPPEKVDSYEAFVAYFREKSGESWERFQERVAAGTQAAQKLVDQLQGSDTVHPPDPARLLQQLQANKAGRPGDIQELLDQGFRQVQAYEAHRAQVRAGLATVVGRVKPVIDAMAELVKRVEAMKGQSVPKEEARAQIVAILDEKGPVMQITRQLAELQNPDFTHQAGTVRGLLDQQIPLFNGTAAVLREAGRRVPSPELRAAIEEYINATLEEITSLRSASNDLFDVLAGGGVVVAAIAFPPAAIVLGGLLVLKALFCLIAGCNGGGGGGGEGEKAGDGKQNGGADGKAPSGDNPKPNGPGTQPADLPPGSKPVIIQSTEGPHRLAAYDTDQHRHYRIWLDGKNPALDLTMPRDLTFATITNSTTPPKIKVAPSDLASGSVLPITMHFRELSTTSDEVRVRWTKPNEPQLLPKSVFTSPPPGVPVPMNVKTNGDTELRSYEDEAHAMLIFEIAFSGRADNTLRVSLSKAKPEFDMITKPAKPGERVVETVSSTPGSDGKATFPVTMEFSGVRADGQRVKVTWSAPDQPQL